MSVAWVGAGIAAVGVAGNMQAGQDAANAQAAGAARSDATQRYFYDTTRADNAPFREAGVAANNKLAYLLGTGNGSGANGAVDANQLTGKRLIDTINGAPAYNADLYTNNAAYRQAWDELAAQHYAAYKRNYTQDSDANWIEQGLRSKLANQFSAEGAANDAAKSDPAYGSLLRNFSAADLAADPVYQSGLQFGLDEGRQGIERQAAASGQQLSGATLKALAKYGNDYASTKANESYNRFNTNQDRTYNKLAGLSGAGQQATNQVSAAGQNAGNNISASQIGAGNARGASAIAQGNALTNGLSQGYNMYQQNRLLDAIQNGNYRPNAAGYGGNQYAGYDAVANGGWGIE